MKVLVYTRPRTASFLMALCKNVSIISEAIYFSDAPGTSPDHIFIMRKYYKFKKAISEGRHFDWQLWSNFDFSSIQNRCRYLRQLSPASAILHIRSMACALNELIEQHNPDVIIGSVMDSYVQDVANILMQKRNSAYLGILNNMLNGYSRLTIYGELFTKREVSEEEIENAISQLSEKYYIPSMQKAFMWSTHPTSMFFSKYIKEKLKYIYYSFKKSIGRDPDNFYSNTVGHESCMSCHNIDQLFYRRYETQNYKDKISQAKKQGKIIVYLPLQFYPECSLDYWGGSSQLSHFHEVMDRICSLQAKEILIVVKEHPSASALRKSNFYEKLSLSEHIIIAPFDERSNEIIVQADIIATWTGSVGIEAIVRGKPLISFGGTYFDPDEIILTINSFDEVTNLEEHIHTAMKNHLQSDSKIIRKQVIHHLLSGLIKGYIFPLDYGSKKNPENQEKMRELASSVSKALKDYVA